MKKLTEKDTILIASDTHYKMALHNALTIKDTTERNKAFSKVVDLGSKITNAKQRAHYSSKDYI